jgi:hypothetical protein
MRFRKKHDPVHSATTNGGAMGIKNTLTDIAENKASTNAVA